MGNEILHINRKLLAKNTLFNLLGLVFPVVTAIFCVPFIIRGIGTERLGILTLVWAVIGYFSLFDFGLGRALTHELAKKLAEDANPQELSAIVWTSLCFLLILGAGGLIIGVVTAHWLTFDILNISESLRQETLSAIYLLSAALPLVILTTGLNGILQAYQRFDLINLVQVPLGVLNFAGPFVMVFFSNSLIPIICVLILLRFLAFMAYCSFSLKVMPCLRKFKVFKAETVKSLFSYGGWLTVTNIVGPFLYYLDRFFLGAMVPVIAVAYYTTPYEVITKLWAIPISLSRVLFPAFSTVHRHDQQRAVKLFMGGNKYVFIAIYPVVLVVMTFAYDGLKLWLGTEFANHSATVLRLLTLGVFINSFAQIAINMIQGMGRPDLSAKAHLVELPIYLLAVWLLIRRFGIEGAAIAWCGRCAVDAIFLFVIIFRFLPIRTNTILRMSGVLALSLIIFCSAFALTSLAAKGLFLASGLTLFSVLAWSFLLSQEDRSGSLRLIKSVIGRIGRA